MLNSNSINNVQRMNLRRHPIVWVTQVLSNCIKNQVELRLSRYLYEPQSFKDFRYELSLPLEQLNESVLLELLISLEADFELAFHSTIYINSQLFHLPMIDFGSKGSSPTASNTIKELCSYWNMSFNIYESGRSFHAYGNRLLNHEQWLQFMGSLLLLNKPSGYKLIDERWVGHRIMGGYSALRWSKNTSHYKKFPTLCGSVSGNHFIIENTPPMLPTAPFGQNF